MSEKTINEHAEIALNEIQEALGDKWATLFEEQQRAAARSARRLVELEFKKRTGEDVSDADIAFVRTTVEGFKLAGEIALYDAFWKGMNKAFEALGSFLVGAGKGLIPGLGTLLAGIDLGGLISD